ncbi:hypothetical protein ACH5RR_014708 [Cinchona calisaya]|uniref:Cystatin domain-containing protein n=1 Tax=Cinchona calisaya TaxID=153742 RepID=A0ABD2ZR26_9GENT
MSTTGGPAVAGGLKLTVQIKPIDLCVPGVISVHFYALVILARDGREISEYSALVLDVTNPMLFGPRGIQTGPLGHQVYGEKRMGKLPSAELDPMLNLSKEGTLWKQMADLKAQKTLSPGQQVQIGDSIFVIVDPKDPAVIEIGKFAVDEQNKKAGTNLQFVEVATGLKLNVPVINAYALFIRANDGQQTQVYGAVVVEVPLVLKQLLFWTFVPFVSLPCN